MKTTAKEIKVTISRLGRTEDQIATIDAGGTVADAFNAVEMDFDKIGRDVFCEGEKAEGSFEVQDGDVLAIVAEKVEAGM